MMSNTVSQSPITGSPARTRFPCFHYRWHWQFAASPDSLWPFVADTNRLNAALGLPAVDRRAGTDAVHGHRRLHVVRLGVPLEWDEEPFEWVRPFRYGVVRRYLRGPLSEMRVLAELQPQPDGGTRLVYEVWTLPKNLLGVLGIPIQIGLLNARSFDRAFRQYATLALKGVAPGAHPANVQLSSGARSRLGDLRQALLALKYNPALVTRLIETITQVDDLAASRLRPYALADQWNAPRRTVLELCLHATRLGLLDFQWDVLCPFCRNAQQSAPTLRGIETTVHCPSCQIDFSANFEQLVEITFRPNPAIRHVEGLEFCVGGPQVTPHIVAQQMLPPHAERTLTVLLEAGCYRLRARNLPGNQLLRVMPGGQPALEIRAGEWVSSETLISSTPTLRLHNPHDQEHLVMLERTTWSDQAVTAADVTALHLFRDLFASEALRPGQQVTVGSLTVLFTDLRDSTRLYCQIGDAVAFGQVIDHFDVLQAAIVSEDGVLVKTIGDAVMAVFRRPLAAVRAIMRAQEQFATPANGMPPLVLKAGIHCGPCITVTLNDRLDYFGTAVNIAARIQHLSHGDDVVLSAAVRHDPEVAAWLAERGARLHEHTLQSRLKGFDEAFDLWRIVRVSET